MLGRCPKIHFCQCAGSHSITRFQIIYCFGIMQCETSALNAPRLPFDLKTAPTKNDAKIETGFTITPNLFAPVSRKHYGATHMKLDLFSAASAAIYSAPNQHCVNSDCTNFPLSQNSSQKFSALTCRARPLAIRRTLNSIRFKMWRTFFVRHESNMDWNIIRASHSSIYPQSIRRYNTYSSL